MSVKKKLIEKFGGCINHMSCVYLNDGENVLKRLAGKIKLRRAVLEIGTYQGVSACVLSELFKDVLTLDIIEKPLLKDIITDYGNVCFIKAKNRIDEKSIVDKLFKNYEIDLVFIDGEHFNGELAKDWDMVQGKCDNILIHDYSPAFPEVYDFINDKAKSGYYMTTEGTFALLVKANHEINVKATTKEKPVKKTEEKPKKKRKYTRKKKTK